ncbi:MAG: type II toxin-antitoxin system VapC family toxin [Candidatus Brocadiales bacterium]|uniref:type II toxin-antitoxin system VapC family toxin n=1 Tax=Candidatus Wunengus sp. YC60 TaxID=3367697 RepID=UPI002712888A|nr:type II toxin-antitoxin system VapC family toxin [Candidatus Brocadiales bacterium]
MKKIMIDTNVYISFKRNGAFILEILRRAEFIGVSIVVLGELLCGFKGGSKERNNREELEQFLDSPRVHIVQMDEETAEYYAKIFWNLKKKGTPIPTNDIWVAASAMRHGAHLFTNDRHFESIEGLLLFE